MFTQDLHTHSNFCDGKNSPEEMVLSAIEKGLKRIGICAHSPVAFEKGGFLPEDRFGKFQKEISRLKDKYKDRIEVLCGIELDTFSDTDISGFDYVIGSVHYVEADGEHIPVDDTPEKFSSGCEKHFGGDYLSFAEAYYEELSTVVEKTNCDIIGHFDLVAKFNAKGHYFNESDPRYENAWKTAADKLLKSGRLFEINTGGISRGYRDVPYPAPAIKDYIASKGGQFIKGSDAHEACNIAYKPPKQY